MSDQRDAAICAATATFLTAFGDHFQARLAGIYVIVLVVEFEPHKPLLVALLLGFTHALIGCTTQPGSTDRLAEAAGFSKALVAGRPFEHVTYLHDLGRSSIEELHIYIEGDGTPWIGGRYPAAEPTPLDPVALKMMALDPGPALYLGRPCYLGMARSAYCSAELWTSRRYSPEVVASMLGVIEYYLRKFEIQRVVLIGYSGGGTLAALLATQVNVEVFLLTLAANLDIDLWASLMGFLPLEGSLNPVDYRQAIAAIPQLHFAGLKDRSVPTAVTESFIAGLDPQFVRIYPTVDHSCCWLDIWSATLAERPWAKADYSRTSREPGYEVIRVTE